MEKELKYPRISMRQFLVGVNTEAKARRLAWKIKYGGEEFLCPHCGKKEFWELKSRPEIRQCTSCKFQVRLRVGSHALSNRLVDADENSQSPYGS